MSLFLTEDGHFQGWLAALLCCCAAVSQDESPFEKAQSRPSMRVGVCDKQPLQLGAMPTFPVARPDAVFKGDEPVDMFDKDYRQKPEVSDRPPSLKPLDLGDTSLMGRWSYHRQKGSLGHHISRPSISNPYGFRRLDHTEAQTQSLVPLRLGPVVLRESPVPRDNSQMLESATQSTARKRSDSTQGLLAEDSNQDSYRQHRETPFQRCQQRKSGLWPLSSQPGPVEIAQPGSIPGEPPLSRRPTAPRSRSTSSSRHRGGESSASSITSRPSSERLRPKRKRSLPSFRDDQEVEREIVELNTIVEERRAENTRENGSDHHIAAVAPSMQIRARSETLDAIGSALSRPITARETYCPLTPTETTSEELVRRSTSATNVSSTRVSGWLSGIFPSSSTAHLPGGDPFYKCKPPSRPLQRSYSESSIITSLTDTYSPSLTVASSPTSKGHSRSHTGESWITPMTSSAIHCGTEYVQDTETAEEHWPITMGPDCQVGLAL